MLKAYKYRIYPNKTQRILLAKTFGSVRFFWNRQVEIFRSYDRESNPKPVYETSTQIRNEYIWMNEVSAAAIQQKEIDFKRLLNLNYIVMKEKWFEYVVANKNLWGNGWTAKRLEKVKVAVLSDKDIIFDLLQRHDGETIDAETMKTTDKIMYDHCIGNFICNIHYKMMELKLIKG